MRAYEDLREFLSVLEQERQLLRITEPVRLEPDLAAQPAPQLDSGKPTQRFTSTTSPATPRPKW
jgi:vanillate/4-hydroxybenzoate decarboxylase subunit C